jgi:endonuclease YncB( thermonuclease family)
VVYLEDSLCAFVAQMRALPVLEAEARTARRGLWADPQPVPPGVLGRPDRQGRIRLR